MKDISVVLHDKLKQIDQILKNKTLQEKHIGVLSGISGISLFQFYYARFLGEEDAELGTETIVEAIERINNDYTFPTFCTGIAGAGWVLEFLNQEGFIEIDNDELLSALDEYLFEAMKSNIKSEYFDFLHGALGYGMYFFKRYQNTNSLKLKSTYRDFIGYLITGMKDASKKDDRGIWWKYELRKKDNLTGVNLSLSHGMSSAINFLSRIYVYDDFKEQVEELLTGAVQFVIHQQYKDKEGASLFPSWIVDSEESYVNSRLAWCYGDLGVGISILHAAKVLQNKAYKELALEVLKHTTKRTDADEARIVDAGLCHGSYGLVMIYQYIYQQTQDEVFKNAADLWMTHSLSIDTHKEGYAGYMVWRGGENEWLNEASMLEGIAGIGLAIISYLNPDMTIWNECLLIS